MNQNVHTHVLARFVMVFGEPKTPDTEAFFREYSKALGGYPATDLERAADWLIKHHKFRSWPTPGEVRDVIEATRPYKLPPPVERAEKNWPLPTPEQAARADELAADLRRHAREVQERSQIISRPARTPWQPPEVKAPADDPERRATFSDYVRAVEAQWFERDREAIRARMAGEGNDA